jgi:hypothetical protein
MEVGVHGGTGYYVGELAPYPFVSLSEAYGAHFRYKFNERWAIQAKGLQQRVVKGIEEVNPSVWNVDVTADFNFISFGNRNFDISKVSPYVFAGVGFSIREVKISNNPKPLPTALPYVPVGVGLKWKFHDRFQLQLAWQHNLYISPRADSLEGSELMYPINQTSNKSNLLNNDVTSTFTVALAFEFAKHRYRAKQRRY